MTGADLARARPPRWAWRYRIVLGNLNLLIGNEGVGKGTLIAWLVGQLTHGGLPGHLEGQPVGVGIIGDEDDFDGTWTPRLHAAGANLELVKQIDRPDGGIVNVREDHEKLVRVCAQHQLRVLFFDQLLDNLGADTNDWRQKAVRDALRPLRSLARELEVAALGCLHPNNAIGLIEALLPKDGQPHPAKPIIDAGAEHDIDKRTMQRAAKRLQLAQRWAKTFPSESLWSWPPDSSDDTRYDPKNDVAPVAPFAPVKAKKPPKS